MRHRNFVYAAFLAILIGFAADSADAQGRRSDRNETPQVMGRVTDFAGRSVRSARVKLLGIESDEAVTVKTNAFGYYRVTGLTKGHSYFISASHRRYIFLIAPTEIVVGDEIVEYDFQGEWLR